MSIQELLFQRPIDADTFILLSEYKKIGGYDTLHEEWVWEGIKAKSIIFLSYQISGLSNDKIIHELKREISNLDEITFCRNSGYIFVNYDFRII